MEPDGVEPMDFCKGIRRASVPEEACWSSLRFDFRFLTIAVSSADWEFCTVCGGGACWGEVGIGGGVGAAGLGLTGASGATGGAVGACWGVGRGSGAGSGSGSFIFGILGALHICLFSFDVLDNSTLTSAIHDHSVVVLWRWVL